MGVNRPRSYIQADALARRIERAGWAIPRIDEAGDKQHWFVIARDPHGDNWHIGSHRNWRTDVWPMWAWSQELPCHICDASGMHLLWTKASPVNVPAVCLACGARRLILMPTNADLAPYLSQLP